MVCRGKLDLIPLQNPIKLESFELVFKLMLRILYALFPKCNPQVWRMTTKFIFKKMELNELSAKHFSAIFSLIMMLNFIGVFSSKSLCASFCAPYKERKIWHKKSRAEALLDNNSPPIAINS